MQPEVRPITATDTHDLRRRVLREGTPSDVVTFPEDGDAEVRHLGAFVDGHLVGVGTFLPRPTPWRPDRRAVQLRGMAVEPARQGSGIGRALLAEAVAQLRAAGTEVLWANARDSALGFYERFGMTVVGDGFVTRDTALPHHVVVLDL